MAAATAGRVNGGSAMGYLQDRWDTRAASRGLADTRPPVTVEVTRSIDIAAPAAATWELLQDIRNGPLVDPTIVRSYLEPGSTEGLVGERTCTVRDDGTGQLSTYVSELVELVPGYRAVVRPDPDDGRRTSLIVTGDETTSCAVLQASQTCAPSLADYLSRALIAYLDDYLARARTHLEAGWRPAAETPGPVGPDV